jgi:hypothetical protein
MAKFICMLKVSKKIFNRSQGEDLPSNYSLTVALFFATRNAIPRYETHLLHFLDIKR